MSSRVMRFVGDERAPCLREASDVPTSTRLAPGTWLGGLTIGGAATWRAARAILLVPLLASFVIVASACDDDDDESLTASGIIETETVDIVSQTGGRVASVEADVGDDVEAGDLLVELDTALLEPQIEGAEAAIEATRAALAALTADPRPEELDVAKARLGVAIAQWDGARRAWENAKDAVKNASAVQSDEMASPSSAQSTGPSNQLSGAPGAAASLAAAALGAADSSGLSGLTGAAGPVAASGAAAVDPQTALNQAEIAYLQAELAVDAATAAIDDLHNGGSPEDVAAAEAKVHQAEAALDTLKAGRDKALLLAPIDGLVVSSNAQPGELVMPGRVLMRLLDPVTTTLTVYVPQDERGNIEEGLEVEVTTDAYEDETFDGEVTYIGEKPEFTPRNVQTEDQRANLVFEVRITVENPDERLKSGMPADAEIMFD